MLRLNGNRQVEMLTHYMKAGAVILWGFPLSTLRADSCAHPIQLLDLLVKRFITIELAGALIVSFSIPGSTCTVDAPYEGI